MCVVKIIFSSFAYYSRAQSTLKCNNDKYPENKNSETPYIHETKRNFLKNITYNYQFPNRNRKKKLSRKESFKRGERQKKKPNQSD